MTYNHEVPFYSQLRDITAQEWRMEGCGIASLAMGIGFYKPDSVSVMKLLKEGIDSNAFINNVGWKHKELAALAKKYGLVGKTYDLSNLHKNIAFVELKDIIKEGPTIVGIYNKFNPKSTLGHLIVATGYDDDFVYYKDPARDSAEKRIANAQFLVGWKGRFITVRPVEELKLEISRASLPSLGATGIF